jgi:hypothetical protein
MNKEDALELFETIMNETPDAIPGLAAVATQLINGDKDAALREAELVAQTIMIKRAARAAYNVP